MSLTERSLVLNQKT